VSKPTAIEQQRGAAELVERARLYDQNAMGILQEMSKNAASGNQTAVTALAQVKGYISEHPAPSEVSPEAAQVLGACKHAGNPPGQLLKALSRLPEVGGADDILAACACVALSHDLTDEWVACFCKAGGPESEEVLRWAVGNAGDPRAMSEARKQVGPSGEGTLCAGHVIGMALRIQRAANGEFALGKEVNWELGGSQFGETEEDTTTTSMAGPSLSASTLDPALNWEAEWRGTLA
jgi:hypothetical protein